MLVSFTVLLPHALPGEHLPRLEHLAAEGLFISQARWGARMSAILTLAARLVYRDGY
jgi:hypothetical protein